MKIATWNVDRPNGTSQPRNNRVLAALRNLNADILVLTETSSLIHPGEEYISCSSTPLLGARFRRQEKYADGENRVTIWSKYPAVPIRTHDPAATACARIQTQHGHLIVYGTVIGIYGRGNPEFGEDLENQIKDWQSLNELGDLCVAGDFNQTLGDDNGYFSKIGRERLEGALDELQISVLTKNLPTVIDHIALSATFLKDFQNSAEIWMDDKQTSTHKGVLATFEFSPSLG